MDSYAFLYLMVISQGRSEVGRPHMVAPLKPASFAASYHSFIHCSRRGFAHCDDIFAIPQEVIVNQETNNVCLVRLHVGNF